MIKTSDFLFKYLVEKHGITDVFLVTGVPTSRAKLTCHEWR